MIKNEHYLTTEADYASAPIGQHVQFRDGTPNTYWREAWDGNWTSRFGARYTAAQMARKGPLRVVDGPLSDPFDGRLVHD